MNTNDNLLSINTVAARLGLSVHQLRRWELMFGLEIKRGRGQQRQYRAEDMAVLERIKELVEQGWPTSQIRPQLEAEGLITPKLIGMPQTPGNPEMLMEAMIGMRSFCERRFIEISKQIDELRQLMISITLKQELKGEIASPWQPLEEEFAPPQQHHLPAQEISIGPAVNVAIPHAPAPTPAPAPAPTLPPPMQPQLQAQAQAPTAAPAPAQAQMSSFFSTQTPLQEAGEDEEEELEESPVPVPIAAAAPAPAPAAAPHPPASMPPYTSSPVRNDEPLNNLGEITDQNYLTVLGRALDIVGWSDEQADQYSMSSFGVAHWDELGRSQAEKLIGHLQALSGQ